MKITEGPYHPFFGQLMYGGNRTYLFSAKGPYFFLRMDIRSYRVFHYRLMKGRQRSRGYSKFIDL